MITTKYLPICKAITLSALLTVSALTQSSDVKRVSVDRYTLATVEPHADQLDLMSVVVDVKFDSSIKTVGDAINELLGIHGFKIGPITMGGYSQYVLYLLPLPEIHRQIGPLHLEIALRVLGGESFDLNVNPVTREVVYRIKDAYDEFLSPNEVVEAKRRWEKINNRPQVDISREIKRCADALAEWRYGPITEGESLSKIAIKVKSSSSTMEQMMMAIFDQNTSGFSEDNINYLRLGAVLDIPCAESVDLVDHRLSKRRVREHYHKWLDFKAIEKATDVNNVRN